MGPIGVVPQGPMPTSPNPSGTGVVTQPAAPACAVPPPTPTQPPPCPPAPIGVEVLAPLQQLAQPDKLPVVKVCPECGAVSAPASSGGLQSPLTTKGDLWGFSSENSRIPVGPDGAVLQADSSAPGGVSWAAVVGVLFTQTADVTVGDSGAELTLLGAGVGTLTLFSDFFKVGKSIRIRMRGYVSDTGTPNFTLNIKLGNTIVLTTGTVSFSGTISNNQWFVEAIITCRSIGIGGTVMSQGSFQEEPDNRAGMVNLSPVGIDTTIPLTIDATFQWGTGSPSNTITCTNATVEVMG